MKNNEKTVRKQRKERIVTFRLTTEDLQRYEQFCISEQIAMSEWLRDQVRAKIQSLPRVEFMQS
jgi:hypothetical protein